MNDCSAEIGDGGLGVGGLDAVGLSWTSWDMIKRCAALTRDSVELRTRGGQNAVFTPWGMGHPQVSGYSDGWG
jgi:hypothetical protein